MLGHVVEGLSRDKMMINDKEHMCYALDFEGVSHTKQR